jgi:MtN3 and saliva related transmembrane protein
MNETLVKVIGLVAGACTSCAIIPQVVTTYKKKKASDVSILMFIVLLSGNLLWIFYGFQKKKVPIIITNFVTVCLNVTMLVLKIKYKDND